MVKATSFAAAAAAVFASSVSAGMQSPPLPASAMFNRPLTQVPVKAARFTFTSPETGLPIDYFEMDMRSFTKQQYPNLPATPQVGYDGMTPGMSSIQSASSSEPQLTRHQVLLS
jgi:hypothetical protein